MSRTRWPYVLPLLLCCTSALAQEIASDPPLQWQADAKQNRKLQKQAEQAEQAARKNTPRTQRGSGNGPGGMAGGPGGGMGGAGGGMGGGMGGPPPDGNGGGPGGKPLGGRGSPPEGATPGLRPELAFAAPLEDTLVLYRTRESVIFGSANQQNVTILPRSGSAVQLTPDLQAFVSETQGHMTVEFNDRTGQRTTYTYTLDPETPGQLKVAIQASGRGDGKTGFSVERHYHLPDVKH